MGYESKRTKLYKVILILLIGLASLSAARKDLNQLIALANDVQTFADRWFGDVLPSAQAHNIASVETCSEKETSETPLAGEDFHWTGHLEKGKGIEIKGISGDISAEPASGADIEVVAAKSARRSDIDQVRIQFVEHPGGVTICALYPSEDPNKAVSCQPGNSSENSGIRNNDVRVDFKVRVPAGVGFIGRTVNGEIRAASLASNVSSHTVNGSIHISTSGYAEAKTVNGEILASLGNSNWPNAIEFKTVNGGITLDLPSSLSTQVSADTFNGEITSDFSLSLSGAISRKHLSGTIGSGGRELVIKTLNGSINLRRSDQTQGGN